MKNKILVLFALLAASIELYAQAPPQLYLVCKRPLGENCNSSNQPISCSHVYSNVDPCSIYQYWSYDQQGNPVKVSCCSYSGTSVYNNVVYNFGGHNFYLGDTNKVVNIKCNGTGPLQSFYNFASLVSNYTCPGVSFLDNGDSLIINLYDQDTITPFIKSGTIIRLAFALTDIDLICNGPLPFSLFFNEIKIDQYPSTEIKFVNNPILNSNLLFEFVNQDALSIIRNIEIIDIKGSVILHIPLSVLESQGIQKSISLADFNSGIYFLRIQTKLETSSHKFIVNK